MAERLPNDIRQRLERVNRSNGSYFADDDPADILYDINAFTEENADKAITLDHIAAFIRDRGKA